MDPSLKPDSYVNTIVKFCLFYLRPRSKIKPSCLKIKLEEVKHAFRTFWLDYWIALLFGISQASVQKAAALFVSGMVKREDVSLVLDSFTGLHFTSSKFTLILRHLLIRTVSYFYCCRFIFSIHCLVLGGFICQLHLYIFYFK